jgi:hypothetical protein
MSPLEIDASGVQSSARVSPLGQANALFSFKDIIYEDELREAASAESPLVHSKQKNLKMGGHGSGSVSPVAGQQTGNSSQIKIKPMHGSDDGSFDVNSLGFSIDNAHIHQHVRVDSDPANVKHSRVMSSPGGGSKLQKRLLNEYKHMDDAFTRLEAKEVALRDNMKNLLAQPFVFGTKSH